MQRPEQTDGRYSRGRAAQPMDSNFSISEMLNPASPYPVARAKSFSGITHHHPPGGKSSIDFSFGSSGASPQQQQPRAGFAHQQQQPASQQWQTSSRAASAAADLSYQLHLQSTPGRPPSAGRRATGGSLSGQDQGQSILAGHSYVPGMASPNSFAAAAPGLRYSTPPSAGPQQFAGPYPGAGSRPQPLGSYPMQGLAGSGGSSGAAAGSGIVDGRWSAGSASSSSSGLAGNTWEAQGSAGASYAGAGSYYSPQMQQLMAAQQQQQQQQQQQYLARQGGGSSNGGYYGAAAPMDMGSSSGAGYNLCRGPSGAAAGSASALDWGATANDWPAAPAQYVTHQHQSSNGMSRGVATPSPRGPAVQPAAFQAGSLSGVPRPAAMAPAFSPSKGAFGGKNIVQPPGGRSTLNIFGGQ